MTTLLFIGDGPRDLAMLPGLVEGILQSRFDRQLHDWHAIRLNRGKGFGRKLLFAVRQARDARLAGVVAVVDADNDRHGERLKALKTARSADRTKAPPFPAALGQARPHGEAWLLDDPVAVRTVLRLAGNTALPNVNRIDSPKESLHALVADSERASEAYLILIEEIARLIARERCVHAADTGFKEFVEEVKAELGPLLHD